MTGSASPGPSRSWFAPEVVQTSAMDCGPAALKCLLEGFGIPASYGRLREACQTEVDGTSIDTLEKVTNDLGVVAEQRMLPADHVFLVESACLPAVVVVRHGSGATHFVVVWRHVGPWLQIMDPAVGRRWVKAAEFTDTLFRHETSTLSREWRDWAGSDDFRAPLQARIAALGADPAAATRIIDAALYDADWFGMAALDACVRMVTSLVRARGVARGVEALGLLAALHQRTCDSPDDIFGLVPADYWSVVPDPMGPELGESRLLLRGAVLMSLTGRAPTMTGPVDAPVDARHLSPELRAALTETAPNPLATLWRLIAVDGLTSPATLLIALALSSCAVLVEAALIRGIFDLGEMLNVGTQRLAAVLGLLSFMALLLAVQFPIIAESFRLGRRLETRLRMALLHKIPRLSDRYFQSRPISDMAERSHTVHLMRMLPAMAVHAAQSVFDLTLTIAGVALVAPASLPLALVIASVAFAVPMLFQATINETDLRMRSHAGALNVFHLDALLGLVPIRVHRAQMALRNQHEALLVEWSRSFRRLSRQTLMSEAVQQTICLGLAGLLLVEHFARTSTVGGGDLLLFYWTLKLPAAGQALASLAHQYPAQRNVLLRLLEPLSAPEEPGPPASVHTVAAGAPGRRAAVSLSIRGGSVVAGGNRILSDIDLRVAAGEHVAIVGPSGAGKSSLVGLLLGWHRLSDGRILVDDAPLDSAALDALRRRTAWVDPSVQLWNRSLVDNLAYSTGEPDVARMATAIEAANLREVVQKLPEGLQTPLGEGGAILSGGEGQRVRLGRALVQADAGLALLDEPFRGLDRAQRASLLDAARRIWRAATVICVTHDIGDTLPFDRVLVVENGTIVEDGNPAELARSASRYADLLEADRLARTRLWRGDHWRHVRIGNGHVTHSR